MGLAASQARFLGITARKSNIEYEGQQVNQQRTALAEEVNALYNKLLAMKVPIAPDTTEFYETKYTFDVTNTDKQDGSYVINSYYKNASGDGYYVNATRTYKDIVAIGEKKSNSLFSAEDGKYYFSSNGEKLELKSASDAEDMAALIKKSYPSAATDELLFYQDKDGNSHYFAKSEIEAAVSDKSTRPSQYTRAEKTLSEPAVFSQANIEFDEKHRISAIIPGDGIDSTSEVNATRMHDDEGYAAALRDYTMSKEEYDKRVEELNAETKSLQQEDKVLELRLNQIDTEQNELQTELEAVKAVLDKNIENTFKTFS